LPQWRVLARQEGSEREMSDLIASVDVPVRIASSHNRNSLRFSSLRYGIFGSFGPDGTTPTQSVEISDADVLGTDVKTFSVSSPTREGSDGWQNLHIVFKTPIEENEAMNLIDNLSCALTVSMIPRQPDAWYGNLFADVDWSSIHLEKTGPAQGVNVDIFVKMTSITNEVINREILKGLVYSEYAEIFVDGVKANQSKSKYASWFILIEKLESIAESEIGMKFERLFTEREKGEVGAIFAGDGQKRGRILQYVSGPSITVKSRAEKLCETLNKINIITIGNIFKKNVPVTVELCKAVIDQRNSLAHTGSTVNDGILYNTLFPLSYEILKYLMRVPVQQ
jgi:hypothetical protein